MAEHEYGFVEISIDNGPYSERAYAANVIQEELIKRDIPCNISEITGALDRPVREPVKVVIRV